MINPLKEPPMISQHHLNIIYQALHHKDMYNLNCMLYASDNQPSYVLLKANSTLTQMIIIKKNQSKIYPKTNNKVSILGEKIKRKINVYTQI